MAEIGRHWIDSGVAGTGVSERAEREDEEVRAKAPTPDSDPDRGNPSCLGQGCNQRNEPLRVQQ
jgi:hypothetical protein